MKNARFVFILIACFTGVDSLSAQGWTRDMGSGFYKVSFNRVQSDEFYEKNGEVLTIPTLSDYTVSLYGEYGVTDHITAVAYVPVLKRLTLNRQVGEPSGFEYFEGDGVTGVADLDLGVKIRIHKWGGSVLTAGIQFGLPTGDDTQENGLYTGDGEFNQVFTAGLGHSFYPVPLYATAYSGFNNRTSGFSDEIRYGVEGGYSFTDFLTAIVKVDGKSSLKNGDGSVSGGTGGLFANDQSYVTYGGHLAWDVTNSIGLTGGITSALYARNTLSAPEFTAGIFFRH